MFYNFPPPPSQVLVASTSGRVFAFDSQFSSLRVGFPLEVDSVVTPVVAHDLTSNGRLELSTRDLALVRLLVLFVTTLQISLPTGKWEIQILNSFSA